MILVGVFPGFVFLQGHKKKKKKDKDKALPLAQPAERKTRILFSALVFCPQIAGIAAAPHPNSKHTAWLQGQEKQKERGQVADGISGHFFSLEARLGWLQSLGKSTKKITTKMRTTVLVRNLESRETGSAG